MEAIRKIIEQSESEIHVDLPESLQGKRLEIIVIAVDSEPSTAGRRPFGVLKDKIQVPDSFFEPLPNDILEGFGAL